MDKDSQLIFKDYKKSLHEQNLLPEPNRLPSKKKKSTNSNNTRSISIPGDYTPRDLPQDPNVKYSYSDETPPDENIIDVESEVVNDVNTLPQAKQPSTKDKPQTKQLPYNEPKSSSTPKPPKYSFSDYYNDTPDSIKNSGKLDNKADELVDRGIRFADRADQKIMRGLGKTAKGVGKAAKLLGKAVGRTIDPFSNKGLLGTAANAASDIENWMRAGGDPLASLRSRFSGIKDIKNKLLNPKTSSEEHAKNIAKFRDNYIYSRDNDNRLTKDFEDKFEIQFPINRRDARKLFGTDIKKRDKNIKTPGHLANIVLDLYNTKVGRGVPPRQAMDQAKGEINNPNIAKYLVDKELLPF